MNHEEEETPPEPSLVWTDHARKCAQSRGVSVRIVEKIRVSADRSPFVGGGCRSFFVSRRKLARLDDQTPATDRERMDGVVLVIDPSTNAVITVLHPHRRDASRYWRGHVGRRYRPRRQQCHWHTWRHFSA